MVRPASPMIDDVAPLSTEDLDCLREVREVLVRHGRSERFSLRLRHQHFVLDSDEAMLESVLPDRTLVSRPIRLAEIELGPNEGIMNTSIDLVDVVDERFVADLSRGDLCRYSYKTGTSEHVHMTVSD